MPATALLPGTANLGPEHRRGRGGCYTPELCVRARGLRSPGAAARGSRRGDVEELAQLGGHGLQPGQATGEKPMLAKPWIWSPKQW